MDKKSLQKEALKTNTNMSDLSFPNTGGITISGNTL
jgi:hypothetical protein